MRGLTSTIALIVVLAGLGAYIYFVDSKKPDSELGGPGGESKEKVFTVDAAKLQELRVTADKETSVLKKENGTWKMVEPVASDVDQNEVSGLTSSLTTLDVNRVVEENPSDLSQYGLADPKIKVAFKAEGGAAGEIYLGEHSPTQSDMYAMKAGEKKVLLVPAFQETSLNKKPFDLRDKRILTIKRDDIDSLDVTGAADYQFTRSGTDWSVKRPLQAKGDYSAVEGLLTRVANANMTRMVEQAPNGGSLAPTVLAKYGLDKPSLTVTMGAGSARATLAFGKEENGALYARDLSRPMIFAVDPGIATDLKKPVDDYRNKDVAAFRAFNLAKLRIVRGADTYEFQKIVATKPNESDKWQRAANGGKPVDVDSAKMDDFLSKLTNLRIASFAAGAAGQPEWIVSASYDEGKFERARFVKAGSDTLVVRDGEAGAGKVDATNYADTVKALDAVTK